MKYMELKNNMLLLYMSLLKEINNHLENIIYRLANVYDIEKYNKLFINYGNINNIKELQEILDKLNLNINSETMYFSKIFNKSENSLNNLENILNSIKNEKDFNLKNIENNSTKYEEINKNILTKINNEITPIIKFFKVKINDLQNLINNYKLIEDSFILKENDFVYQNNNIDDGIFSQKYLVERIFEKININEIYKINEELAGVNNDLLTKFNIASGNDWFKIKNQIGGDMINFTKTMFIYLEAITNLKQVYSELMLKITEYNKLAIEWILFLLLVKELHKKIIAGKKIKRFLDKDDVNLFLLKIRIKELIILENDILLFRIKKILEKMKKDFETKKVMYLDIYQSNHQLELLLMVMIFLE